MIIPFHKPKPHKTRDGKIGLTLKAHNIDTIIDIGTNTGGAHDAFRRGGANAGPACHESYGHGARANENAGYALRRTGAGVKVCIC